MTSRAGWRARRPAWRTKGSSSDTRDRDWACRGIGTRFGGRIRPQVRRTGHRLAGMCPDRQPRQFRQPEAFLPLVIFFVEVSGAYRAHGLEFRTADPGHPVVSLSTGRLDPARSALRTLLCLVVPPLVFDRDQRGSHDKAANSVAVRRSRRRESSLASRWPHGAGRLRNRAFGYGQWLIGQRFKSLAHLGHPDPAKGSSAICGSS